MYLPKTKYTVSIAKPGEYTLNGETYVGPVITTYNGKIYAGEDIQHTTGTLERVKTIDSIVEYPIVPIKRVPVESEYLSGFMVRYFCQDKRSSKVFEISKNDFESGRNNADLSYYTFVKVVWSLTGAGAVTSNRNTIKELEKTVSGIVSSKVLYNPEQFYRELVK